MGVEIERRFLVDTSKLPDDEHHSEIIRQAYFTHNPWIRIRIIQGNTPKAILTIKGSGTIQREEVNCQVPMEKAEEMWPLAKLGEVNKIRHHFGPWEVDEFTDKLGGLWLAEIELNSPDEAFDKPEWLGREVTEDERYSNAYLAEYGIPHEDSR